MTMQQDRIFAFGLGYSASVLAARLGRAGWQVGGTVRSAEKVAALLKRGIGAQIFTAREAVTISDGAHWLICVPPNEAGCPIHKIFSTRMQGAASLTYLSTTGVYGDLGGDWAFEWTAVNPSSARARYRVRAEDQWAEACAQAGVALRIVRLPGIYGPGRSPFDRLRAGTAERLIKPGQVFSRIHVDDISTGLEAMMRRADAEGVFHLCDDEPVPPQDVIAFAAELMGAAIPEPIPFEEAELSFMARSFWAECKRVSNARAKAALGWFPQYPTYRDGLRAIAASET